MEIVQKPALKVVGLRVTATWDDLFVRMPETWKTFIARHAEVQHRVDDIFLDVSLSKRGDEYTQLVGVEVSDIQNVPDQMEAVKIPRQRYIYHRHTGPVTGIAASFGEMYAWADRQDVAAEAFKLDIGYTPEGTEATHDLFVRVGT